VDPAVFAAALEFAQDGWSLPPWLLYHALNIINILNDLEWF